MKTKNIDDYIKRMEVLGYDRSTLLGCTPEEVSRIEEKYSISLPDSYKSFLLRLGKNSNLVDKNEYSIDYESVLKMTERQINYIREIEKEALEEGLDETVLNLPDNAFLILERCDGGQFYFIIAEGGEDSKVYYYNTDLDIIKKEHDSFWDILDMFLKGLVIDDGSA